MQPLNTQNTSSSNNETVITPVEQLMQNAPDDFTANAEAKEALSEYWNKLDNTNRVSSPASINDFVKNYRLGKPHKFEKRQKVSNYETMRKLFIGIAYESVYPKNFEYNDHNKKHLENLIKWFIHDDTGKLDLNKGICLCGGVGVGKTHLFKIFQRMVNSFGKDVHKFTIVKCPTATKEVDDDSKRKSPGKVLKELYNGYKAFDDLGAEPLEIKIYGNSLSVMSDIIFEREAKHENIGQITHFTTNLTPEEIEKRYGTRIYDRLKKMCNVIVMDQDFSFRK